MQGCGALDPPNTHHSPKPKGKQMGEVIRPKQFKGPRRGVVPPPPPADRIPLGEALKHFPRPLPVFPDFAVCPWCGQEHGALLFGGNLCTRCNEPFVVGMPPWGDTHFHLLTYVEFPHKQFEQVGAKPEDLPNWRPNEDLISIYEDVKEWRAEYGAALSETTGES